MTTSHVATQFCSMRYSSQCNEMINTGTIFKVVLALNHSLFIIYSIHHISNSIIFASIRMTGQHTSIIKYHNGGDPTSSSERASKNISLLNGDKMRIISPISY